MADQRSIYERNRWIQNPDSIPGTIEMPHNYPYLWQLFGGYFHQDWPYYANSAEEAIEQYKRDSLSEELENARREINKLLSAGHTEQELKEIVSKELGCCYYPPKFSQSYQDWLRFIRQKLLSE